MRRRRNSESCCVSSPSRARLCTTRHISKFLQLCYVSTFYHTAQWRKVSFKDLSEGLYKKM